MKQIAKVDLEFKHVSKIIHALKMIKKMCVLYIWSDLMERCHICWKFYLTIHQLLQLQLLQGKGEQWSLSRYLS